MVRLFVKRKHLTPGITGFSFYEPEEEHPIADAVARVLAGGGP